VKKLSFVLIITLAFVGSQSLAQVLVGPVVSGNVGWPTYKDGEKKDALDVQPGFGYLKRNGLILFMMPIFLISLN